MISKKDIIKKSRYFILSIIERNSFSFGGDSKYLKDEIDEFISDSSLEGYNVSFIRIEDGKYLKIEIFLKNMTKKIYSEKLTIDDIKEEVKMINRNKQIDKLID